MPVPRAGATIAAAVLGTVTSVHAAPVVATTTLVGTTIAAAVSGTVNEEYVEQNACAILKAVVGATVAAAVSGTTNDEI